MIVEKENVKIGQNAIEKLIEGSCHGIFISTEHILVSAGDMRRSITYLQSLHRLNAEEISPADVLDVAAMCDDDRVRSIIQAAHQISFDKLIQKVKDLLLVSFSEFLIAKFRQELVHNGISRTVTQRVNSWSNYWIK